MSNQSRRASPPERASPGEPISSALLDAVFGALAHPARRRILLVLHARGGAMTAGEVADRFKHAWPTTTRHLRVLERAQIVEVARRGRQRLYGLRPALLVNTARWLHEWSAFSAQEGGDEKRPAWRDLPYATMRNTVSPGGRQRKGSAWLRG